MERGKGQHNKRLTSFLIYSSKLIHIIPEFGFRLAMELHMVHKSEEGHLAVIGVLFSEGAPNAFISRVMFTAIVFGILF